MKQLHQFNVVRWAELLKLQDWGDVLCTSSDRSEHQGKAVKVRHALPSLSAGLRDGICWYGHWLLCTAVEQMVPCARCAGKWLHPNQASGSMHRRPWVIRLAGRTRGAHTLLFVTQSRSAPALCSAYSESSPPDVSQAYPLVCGGLLYTYACARRGHSCFSLFTIYTCIHSYDPDWERKQLSEGWLIYILWLELGWVVG